MIKISNWCEDLHSLTNSYQFPYYSFSASTIFLAYINIMNIFILLSINFVYGFLGNIVSNAKPLPYEAIFNFGDSFSDTGNAGILYPQYPGNKKPYGSTYFKHPTGRMSDGRLMIDFIGTFTPFL